MIHSADVLQERVSLERSFLRCLLSFPYNLYSTAVFSSSFLIPYCQAAFFPILSCSPEGVCVCVCVCCFLITAGLLLLGPLSLFIEPTATCCICARFHLELWTTLSLFSLSVRKSIRQSGVEAPRGRQFIPLWLENTKLEVSGPFICDD